MIASHGFTAEAVSENLMAGHYMARRASLQCGTHLPPGVKEHVGTGLGQRLSDRPARPAAVHPRSAPGGAGPDY